MNKDADYLFSIRNYVLAVTGLFILSLILGYLESAAHPETSGSFLEAFKDLAEKIKTIESPLLQLVVLFLIIFLNNALKSLAIIILGAGFGIIPLFFVAYNGQAIGIVVYIFSKERGLPYVLAALLPHGIIEIPVILISAGIGVRIGYRMFQSLREGRTDHGMGLVFVFRTKLNKIKVVLVPELRWGVGFYVRRLLPLLFLAAMVESLVTPLVINLLPK